MITDVKITDIQILSDNWYTLKKVTYTYTTKDGVFETQVREAYDRGNGAAILLYNVEKKTVILTRQFRLPTYINGNTSGMMIEVCAGMLDADNPEDCIRRETEEETGYRITDVQKVFEVYMSPGAVTEILYLFIAAYAPEMKISAGGGLASEQENIEVLEVTIADAMIMMQTGEIKDAKTIMLLQHIRLTNIL